MHVDELKRAIGALSGVSVRTADARIRVAIHKLGDGVHLDADNVDSCRAVVARTGDPAVQLGVLVDGVRRPLILASDDVLFAPASAESQHGSSVGNISVRVPRLVAYTELMRDAEALARHSQRDLRGLAASFLLVRCCIMGAVRFGLWPIEPIAWWQQGWNALEGAVPMPPFREDPIWNALAKDGARLPLAQDETGSEVRRSRALSVKRRSLAGDFRAVSDVMVVPRLDAEFLELWNRWIQLAPSTFVYLLTGGLSEAKFELYLYAEGAGAIDLRGFMNGALAAFVQLRFSSQERVMNVDEIKTTHVGRGTGLLERLLSNTEQLAAALEMRRADLRSNGEAARIGHVRALSSAFP